MHKGSAKYALFISISTAIILAITFLLDGYISKEGFNPSDDGVILAQSFRIINGEMPHKDFISIRPVFSGLLHAIHFYSPLPLVISGRVFALIEYYLFSVLWVYILIALFLKGTRKDYFHVFLPLIFVSFLLNLNTYHLYPWTTIDGILFSILGFFFFMKARNKNKIFWKSFLFCLSLFSVSLATLSKQNFIFLAIFLYLFVGYDLLKSKKIKIIPLIMITGALPFIAYLVFLLAYNATGDFISQMSGRTEFFQTAVIRYVIALVNSKLIILHVFSMWILLLDIISNSEKNKTEKYWRTIISFQNRKFLNVITILYLVASVFFSFWFILHNDYHSLPFEFFWIMLFLFLINIYKKALSGEQMLVFSFGLLIAWTASISLGANSPVYASGILVSGAIILIYNLLKQTGVLPLRTGLKYFMYITILILMHGFYFSSIFGQTKYNYRELASKHLKKELGKLLPEFGKIRTNQNTYDYYSEFIKIYHEFNLHDRFVLLPNNAVIYPVLDSKNPFPLDWMQGAEFVGSEERVLEMISNIIKTKDIYLIIDKIDSKNMAYGLRSKEYDNINYPYMDIIKDSCIKIPYPSKYFEIYKSR